MAGRKLTRVRPTETPPPEVIPVPQVHLTEDDPRWASIRLNTWSLCGLWDKSDAAMKKILLPSMMELLYAMRAAALENGGFGRSRGEARDVHRAKYTWITGRKFSRDERCTAITKAGIQCKNYPIVGEVHCHTVGHATAEERARSWARTAKWQEHFQLMLENIGAGEAFMALSERINTTREM